MGHVAHKFAVISAALACAGIPLMSQTPAVQKPSFEIVSVKPSPPGTLGPRGFIGPRGDRFVMPGATLRMLVQFGYVLQSGTTSGPIQSGQIIGGPSWMDSDRFDVEAKADCSRGPVSYDQMQLMLQSVLESRFQLKAHYESQEALIYNLVVAKDGPKIKLSEDQTPARAVGPPPAPLCAPPPTAPAPDGQRGIPFDPRGPLPRGGARISGGPSGTTFTAAAVPLSALINTLRQSAGRPVVDKTGLTGLFDIRLQYGPEGMPNVATPFGPVANPAGAAGPPAAADPLPSLFTAIQEQLGLKLEASKAPVEVLVIESAQKPVAN